MDGFYSEDMRIGTSLCDSSMKLGLHQTFALFEDIASEHGMRMGIDGESTLRRSGAFWVMVRARIRYYQPPTMMDTVRVSTWATPPEEMRCDRYYSMEKDGTVLAEARFYWALIDAKTGKARPMRSIHLDWDDIAYRDKVVCGEPFTQFTDDFREEERVACVPVRTSDIDFVHHMNNVEYVRLLTDTFSASELERTPIREVEINYCGSAQEGETLDIFRRERPYGWDFAVRRPGGKVAVLALLRR